MVVCKLLISGFYVVVLCWMGKDNVVVVDNELKVKGVEGLCVVDCFVMVVFILGNINGLVMVIGWWVFDIILNN